MFFSILLSFLIASLWLGLAGASVMMMWRGWRGRRLDEHPHCAACRYDLYGLARGVRRCPECGGSLRALGAVVPVALGPSPPMIITGMLVLLLSLSPAVLIPVHLQLQSAAKAAAVAGPAAPGAPAARAAQWAAVRPGPATSRFTQTRIARAAAAAQEPAKAEERNQDSPDSEMHPRRFAGHQEALTLEELRRRGRLPQVPAPDALTPHAVPLPDAPLTIALGELGIEMPHAPGTAARPPRSMTGMWAEMFDPLLTAEQAAVMSNHPGPRSPRSWQSRGLPGASGTLRPIQPSSRSGPAPRPLHPGAMSLPAITTAPAGLGGGL